MTNLLRAFPSIFSDIIGFAASVLVLILYHTFLYMKKRRNPFYTMQSVNREARSEWVEWVMENENRAILAVQTLRNSTMSATFLASTAVLLMMGTLTLTGQAANISASWQALNLGTTHPGWWVLKVMLLVIDFYIAFFSFALSVRLFNHVGYQINLPESLRKGALSHEHVARYMNRAGHYYSNGMRAYFFAVPLVFWLFGPHLMFVSALVLVAVLYNYDRMPG